MTQARTPPRQAIFIRAPRASDEQSFLEAARRSRRLHAGFVTPPLSSDNFQEFLARSRGPTAESFLVFEQHSRALAGVINLNEIVRRSFQSAILGYFAFEPHAGRGLMHAGLRSVLGSAFRELRLHRVEANIQPNNERSLRLVQSVGFQKEGYSRRYLKVSGKWRDHERWALLREDWRPSRRAGRT